MTSLEELQVEIESQTWLITAEDTRRSVWSGALPGVSATRRACDSLLHTRRDLLRARLGTHYCGEDEESVSPAVQRLAKTVRLLIECELLRGLP